MPYIYIYVYVNHSFYIKMILYNPALLVVVPNLQPEDPDTCQLNLNLSVSRL